MKWKGYSDYLNGWIAIVKNEQSKKVLLLDQVSKSELTWDLTYQNAVKKKVPEDILNIQGKPTKEEIDIIKMHPYYGELITRGIPGIEMTNQIARYHHEGWDGKGYEGLAGEEINLSSRITSLVDKVDALFSSRIYRKWHS